MRLHIVTALFDIGRETKGDGRKIADYLIWFSQTLKVNYDMTVYTEEKFYQFVLNNRPSHCQTNIILQEFGSLYFYKYFDAVSEILKSDVFKFKIKSLSRIESYFPEYIIVIYSKFDWLKNVIEQSEAYDYFVWMDAGYSRFFGPLDLSINQVNVNKILNAEKKITIRADAKFTSIYPKIDPENYFWEVDAYISAGLFGGLKDSILAINEDIENLFKYTLHNKCVNNEQILLSILAKQQPQLFNVVITPQDRYMTLHDLVY